MAGASSLVATKLTKKYKPFLPPGAKIINYKNAATGRTCDICFALETEVLTTEGPVRLADVLGQEILVLTPEGWRTALVEDKGVQETRSVLFGGTGSAGLSITAEPPHRG